MRLQILAFLSSLFVFVLATGSLEDKSHIEDVLAAFDFTIDAKKFNELGKTLDRNVIYDQGEGPPIQGLSLTTDALSNIILPSTISFTSLGTKLIKFRPPFDKNGRSNSAEAISYSTFSFFGSGNSTGEILILFVKFVDKEIVKTNEPGFGGWRIKNRKTELVVSLSLNPKTCDIYHPPPPCCPKEYGC